MRPPVHARVSKHTTQFDVALCRVLLFRARERVSALDRARFGVMLFVYYISCDLAGTAVGENVRTQHA
jgi:hypothetical protein